MDVFLGLLSDDVVHDINQGGREVGKAARVSNYYNLQDWLAQVSA